MIAVSPAMQGHWDWRAAGNFILGGTGSGLMLFAAWAERLGILWVQVTASVSLVLVALGLTLVWFEIGRPWRFLNVLRNPATSWMSREAWAAIVLMGSGAAGIAVASPVFLLLAAFAGLVFLYCQARILRSARGIPAWREVAVPALITTTGLTEGGSLLLAATAIAGEPLKGLWLTVIALLGMRTLLVLTYASRLWDGRAPNAVVQQLPRMIAATAAFGGLLPLLLIALAPPATPPAIAACFIAVVTGWHLKYMIVRPMALMQGFALQHTPARGASANGTGARPGW